MFWNHDILIQLTGGRWITPPRSDTGITGVTIDSRAIHPGHIFVAIRGERFDGHDFVVQALHQDASVAIIAADHESTTAFDNMPADQLPGNILVVDDTVQALQDLARGYRDALAAHDCKVIAVVGSNGKTTTRHFIHSLLVHCGQSGSQSPASFNNHFGLPLTLLAADLNDDFVACEIGTNHPGEVADLAAIARPDLACITSIGAEHLEFFGDLDGVAREEASIAAHLKPNGSLFCSAQAHGYTASHLQGLLNENTPLHVVDATQAVSQALIHDLPLPGEHQQANAAMAAAIAQACGCDNDCIRDGVAHLHTPSGRWQEVQIAGGADSGGITLIHDAYNANPDSMTAALHTFAGLARANTDFSKRFIPVLGDMLELGDAAEEGHHQIVRLLAEINQTEGLLLDPIFLIGPDFAGCGQADTLLDGTWYSFAKSDDAIIEATAQLLQPGDTVLLKASRGLKLERLIDFAKAQFES